MSSRHRAFGLALVLIVLLTACEKRESSPVLLQIDGLGITLAEFRQEFEKTLPPDQKLTPEELENLQRSYLVQLVDRRLAMAEATRLGIQITPEHVDAALNEHRRDYPGQAFEQMLQERGITLAEWRGELEEGLLIEKVARQAAYQGLRAEEEEIQTFFEEHREEFDRPAQVRARQIVVGSEAEGQEMLGLLRQGQPFAEVARSHSLSPDSEEGGDLGFFARGDMPPEFERVVFSIPVGRISELVKSEYGFHIFLVEERRNAVRLTMDDVREEIRRRILAEKEEVAYEEWLNGLRGRATIEVNWSLL